MPRFGSRRGRGRTTPVHLFLVPIVGALTLGACGAPTEEVPAAAAAPASTALEPAALDPAALDDPSRPEAERDQDAGRKPIEVYEFFGIRPGDTVADVYAADGYNTHLLARLVGDGGRVYSVLEFYGDRTLFDGQLYKADSVAQRISDAGLDNVELAMTLADVPTESVDVAVAVRSYHDVEWTVPGYTRADQLTQLWRIVKPGGSSGSSRSQRRLPVGTRRRTDSTSRS